MKKIRTRKPNKRKEESDTFFSDRQHQAKESATNDGFFQPKLEISDPSDAFELEAEAMADQVVQQEKKSVDGTFGDQSVQRQAEEEEPAMKQIQRQAEEEEPAAKQIQRQAEEEEPAAKRIQRQAEEEEPAARRIQRQAEEEEPAAKRIQRQAEEEEPAAKRIQRQAEEEEPAAKRIQRQTEEEEPAAKRIQRQTEAHHADQRLTSSDADVQTKSSSSKKDSEGKKDNMTMDSVEAMIQETKGQGMPLPEEIRTEMQSKFEADFTKVRIHTDAMAIKLSALLNAQAFTHGYDIYFNRGKYDPYSKSGKHLLAHELTHVVQQKG